jgi:hypothetical protein
MAHLILDHGVSAYFGTTLAPCDMQGDLGLSRLQRVVRRGRPLKSTTTELIRDQRNVEVAVLSLQLARPGES